ncbi:hypothetical protein [Mitsuaria sp. GD03876]|uniref:hypothetical protein n=1 Tax=Mitsuaria sp. GD03876 TaxID=2975399 RepID=UPI002446D7C7|nr:hypothetical protein [Mitsuaria sp. GD03876]MDH0867471.1 hypothetical protein [Mitsuaria sp. GD03876]
MFNMTSSSGLSINFHNVDNHYFKNKLLVRSPDGQMVEVPFDKLRADAAAGCQRLDELVGRARASGNAEHLATAQKHADRAAGMFRKLTRQIETGKLIADAFPHQLVERIERAAKRVESLLDGKAPVLFSTTETTTETKRIQMSICVSRNPAPPADDIGSDDVIVGPASSAPAARMPTPSIAQRPRAWIGGAANAPRDASKQASTVKPEPVKPRPSEHSGFAVDPHATGTALRQRETNEMVIQDHLTLSSMAEQIRAFDVDTAGGPAGLNEVRSLIKANPYPEEEPFLEDRENYWAFSLPIERNWASYTDDERTEKFKQLENMCAVGLNWVKAERKAASVTSASES